MPKYGCPITQQNYTTEDFMTLCHLDDIKKYEPFWGSWYVDKLIGSGNFGKVYTIYKKEYGFTYTSALKYIKIPSEHELQNVISMVGQEPKAIEAKQYSRIFWSLQRAHKSRKTVKVANPIQWMSIPWKSLQRKGKNWPSPPRKENSSLL